ncbi:hypothetical protein [Paraburkholderia sp.]|uniref:hypothetical protein n=1 Tax=Paraburkholderia sp. TaxID=1926495 RepID=UPI0025DB78AE|nr:hypothetical protein [Paraburkholderia sp.]
MIKVSILYPHRQNGRFDSEYYTTRHMPLAQTLLDDIPNYTDSGNGTILISEIKVSV